MKRYLTMQKACLVLGVFWLLVIWGNSLRTAAESAAQSGGLLQLIQPLLLALGVPGEIQHNLLRKLAHMAEFAVLGLLWSGALRGGKKAGLKVLAICVAAASLDETIQLFVPGRSGEIRDVLIDTLGGILGICCAVLLRAFAARRSRK